MPRYQQVFHKDPYGGLQGKDSQVFLQILNITKTSMLSLRVFTAIIPCTWVSLYNFNIAQSQINGEDRGGENTQLRQRALENPTHQFSPMGFLMG